jgi:hypothetical protein
MLPWLAAMVQYIGVGAASFFQSISQDWQAVEGSFVIDALSQLDQCAEVPRQP